YPPFHLVLTLLAGAVLCGGALLVLPRGPKLPSAARSVLAGVLCGSVFCLAATHLFHEGDLRRRAVTGQLSVERLIHLVQAAADLDGDGVSPLLGGGDCDDLSASINPLRRDLPGNHVDEDCDGRDSTEAEVRQAALAWQAHGDASFDAGSNARRLREAAATGHILLITVDALRRDHALDDHGALLLPSLQVLPGPAVTATRAMAPGTTTQLSLPAMLTGRFDYDNARSSLVLDLRREGVDTLLVTHRAVLDQLAQGNFGESYPPFDVSSHFDRVIGVGPAAGEGWGGGITRGSTGEMLEAFLAAWDGMGSGRRFCWLHFFDPHQWNQLEEVQHLDGPKDRYRAVLAEVDRAVRQVLGELLRRGDGERLLILFSSDHGEGLGDRNIRYHTKLAYGVLAEVPLLLWARGLQPRLLDTPVSLMDLRPTLHALVTGRPCAECEGCSLVGAFDDPSWTRPAPILISEYYQQAVVSGTLKLIVDRFSHTMELYDLAADPLETMDLSRRQPDELARLLGLLKASPHYREPEGRALR
ncbi:MAG: sulfatase-like hydrolase/transferase, partial [Deltaproteobacteria bacterium]|nr:sulfatase-like hydrolase/transferase [Deltaproteobacteria bacterium]